MERATNRDRRMTNEEKLAEEYYYETYTVTSNFEEEAIRKKNIMSAFLTGLKTGKQEGAEFGYNKANEWHYVKDGDLPKDTTSLYLVRVYSWNFSFSHLYKKYTTYIPTVCEWNGEYFTALDDMAYSNARHINSCVAWKEIVLPELKEIKEND